MIRIVVQRITVVPEEFEAGIGKGAHRYLLISSLQLILFQVSWHRFLLVYKCDLHCLLVSSRVSLHQNIWWWKVKNAKLKGKKFMKSWLKKASRFWCQALEVQDLRHVLAFIGSVSIIGWRIQWWWDEYQRSASVRNSRNKKPWDAARNCTQPGIADKIVDTPRYAFWNTGVWRSVLHYVSRARKAPLLNYLCSFVH